MLRTLAFLIASLTLISSPTSALTPEEAAQHIGKEGAVDGIAVQVSEFNGSIFVNLGAKFPDHTFSAYIAREDVPAVGLAYLKSMEGRPVSIVGRIMRLKGRPQIQVTKKEQIILAAQPSPATPPR